MTRSDLIRLAGIVLLGILCSLFAVRIARHLQVGLPGRVELGRHPLTRLEAGTRETIAGLDQRLSLTYYVSRDDAMPSHMRGIERRVVDLLEAIQSVAPERVSLQIVDPATHPELAGFSSRRRIAPYTTRTITHDSYDEKTIWSSLSIAYGSRKESIVNGIGPERLPRLQSVIVEHLASGTTPRRPVFALAAPAGFGELHDSLAEKATVRAVDLEGDAAFPFEADVLFWIQPREVSSRRLRELERFRSLGKSIVLAGSALAFDGAGLISTAVGPALRVRRAAPGFETVLTHYGLAPWVALLCDERAESLVWEEETYTAPFLVRCIAPNQDFQGWRMQPNGNLWFTLPTPLAADAAQLRDRGLVAHTLASSSDRSWLQDVTPDTPMPVPGMRPENGLEVAKQALAIALEPDDPWQGKLVVLASTSPFEDGMLSRAGAAHPRLVQTLVRELASPERLVLARTAHERAQPLPELSWRVRLIWRAVCVGSLPALLVAWTLRRRRVGTPHTGRGPAALLRATLIGGGAIGVLTMLGYLPGQLDLSADRWNQLAPATRAWLSDHPGAKTTVELVFSPGKRLPAALRHAPARAAELLDEFARHGADLELQHTRPDPTDANALRALAADGIVARRIVQQLEESVQVQRIFAALRFTRGENTTVVPLDDARTLDDLEFAILFALWRLGHGAPQVAFASDVPRLSAAEAYEDFQQKGLFAPKGTDVYRDARALLTRTGYRVTHVNPRAPELPADADALVWLQPRRSIEPMLEETLRYLHGGGNVLLAAQHFNIQSRQYRGADFDVKNWPQPQTPDIDIIYFPELGIELVREVLFDELNFTDTSTSRVTGRRAEREFERQETALPFLVRLAAANMDPDSRITAHLGDQALAWPAYLRWDAGRLEQLGLRARALLSTSERTWSYDWSGGWIPRAMLDGPARAEAGAEDAPAWLGSVPVAALFEGTFPRPEKPLRLVAAGESEADEAEDGTGAATEPWPDARAGRLLLIGASEPFKDGRLDAAEFRADHLLLNAVAELALPPELAEVATRRRVTRGFDWVPAQRRWTWRALVVGSGPLGVLLTSLAFFLLRRRAPRPPRTGGRS